MVNPEALQRKNLSKHNLEALQDDITSLPLPDSVLECKSQTPTMTSELPPTLPSTAPSGSHVYSRSYAHTLYLLGVVTLVGQAIIPSVPDHTEVSNLDSAPNNLSLLSTFMKNWVKEFEPNEASLANFLCRCLFQPEETTSSEYNVTILHEVSGPFKSHNLHELMAGDQAIKYPLIKRDSLREELDILQKPAEIDLRARSDFVFAASTEFLGRSIAARFQEFGIDHTIPGLCNNLRCCAVAIVAEVKATFSHALLSAAKNQWSSLAYLQMMERVSIKREATYVDDENICQYGYCICGLRVVIWKMGLKWNRVKRPQSEILDSYFTFPVQVVDVFNLEGQEAMARFISIHREILRWWLGRYIPSYVKDITDNVVVHPIEPKKWRTTWQQAVSSLSPGEDLEIKDLDITCLEEQPARPLVEAENEDETPQQDDTESHGDGICQGITRSNTQCRKKVKIGKYCLFHKKV